MKISVSFDLGQRVSSVLSILLVLVMSVLVAVLTLNAAKNVLASAEGAAAFHVDKRVGTDGGMNP